jgi:hypothetical protein
MDKHLDRLTDDELRARIALLVTKERDALVELLWGLAELDRRRGYAEVGYPSLMAYCTDKLKMSVGGAYRRMTAARMMAKHPVIAEYLGDGRLCKDIWERAMGCCEFTAADGKRCGGRYQLEYHHEIPDARGGPATVENIFLYCRAHNVHGRVRFLV